MGIRQRYKLHLLPKKLIIYKQGNKVTSNSLIGEDKKYIVNLNLGSLFNYEIII